jgi:hypothetical protein
MTLRREGMIRRRRRSKTKPDNASPICTNLAFSRSFIEKRPENNEKGTNKFLESIVRQTKGSDMK